MLGWEMLAMPSGRVWGSLAAKSGNRSLSLALSPAVSQLVRETRMSKWALMEDALQSQAARLTRSSLFPGLAGDLVNEIQRRER